MDNSKILQAGLLATALAFPGVTAAAYSPFAALAGNWSGGGVLQSADGTQERLRCRAGYDVGGVELRLTLRCASASYNFDLTSDVQYRGGAITGSWREASRRDRLLDRVAVRKDRDQAVAETKGEDIA